MQCDEIPGLKLKDGATRIFLNTHGQNPEEVPAELVEFLKFAEDTPDAVFPYKSPRVKKLAHQIDRIKKNQEVGVKYMQLWEEMEYERRESRAEGKAEGKALNLIQLVRKKLKKNLEVQEIADLLEEDDTTILRIRNLISEYPDSPDDELAEIFCGHTSDQE